MFCRKCGNELVAGAKFCPKCGTQVEEVKSATESKTSVGESKGIPTESKTSVGESKGTPTESKAPVEESKGTPTEGKISIEGSKGTPTESKMTEGKGSPAGAGSLPHTGNSITIIILGVCVVLALVLAIFLGVKVIGPMLDDGSKQMIYLEDDELYYLKNMNKPDKAIEVDRLYDMKYLTGAQFSEDGKYLYYYSECDDDYNFTLNRVKLSKLKANSKNDKYVEEIASDVQSYILSDNNVIYYLDDNNSLIQYKNGKEKILEKEVGAYTFSEDNSKIFYTIEDDDELTFCSVNVSNGKTKEMDDGIAEFNSFGIGKYYIYTKSAGDETSDVYVTDGAKEPVCVAKDVYAILNADTDTGLVYYETEETVEKKLYDFVNDTAAEEDAKIKEPERKDALVEVSEDKALETCISEYMKDEYMTGKAKDLQKYYDNLSYDEDMQMYYDYSKETYDDYYYDATAKKWYVYDSDVYDEAWDKFSAIEDRVELREDLQEETYTSRSYTVYSASMSQKEKEICSGVESVSVDIENKLVMYSKISDEAAKLDIMDIEYVGDVTEYLDEAGSASGEKYYKIGDSDEQSLDLDGNVYVVDSSEKGKIILAQYKEAADENCALVYMEVAGGKLANGKEITDESYSGSCRWVNGVLYYLEEYDEDKEVATLCEYKNGKSKVVLEDVSPYVSVTTDSRILEWKDDLALYDMSGESVKIANDVQSYSYLAKDKIVYIANDDLYLYTGSKEEVRIAKDVSGYVIYVEQCGEDEKEYSIANYYD